MYNKARGIDHNEVKAVEFVNLLGLKRTFSTDVNDDDVILRKIKELSGKTAERLNKIQKSGKTVTVKIKRPINMKQSQSKKFERSLFVLISIILPILYITT